MAFRFKKTGMKLNGKELIQNQHKGISSLKTGNGIAFLKNYFDYLSIMIGMLLIVGGLSYILMKNSATENFGNILCALCFIVVSVVVIIYNILVDLMGRKKDIIKINGIVVSSFAANQKKSKYRIKLLYCLDGEDYLHKSITDLLVHEPITKFRKKNLPADGSKFEILYSLKYKRALLKSERHIHHLRIFIAFCIILICVLFLIKKIAILWIIN